MKRMFVGICLLLMACDDGTVISHVDKAASIELSDLVAMQVGGGIRTEIHGTPFERTTSDDLTRFLRPPSGASQATKWRDVPVGSVDHGYRMVLHFNPSGPPNAFEDCRRKRPAITLPPMDVGFTVNMTFCKGEEWEAHGFLKATKTEARDFQDYTRVMRALMNNIFTSAGNDR
ncbi:MAG: hypothetical protein AAF415_06485 [Pseudomonadota bacterium]